MKKNKSILSILGVLLLSLSVVSGASAGSPSLPHPLPDNGGGTPKPPTCVKYPCPLPN